jgi:hypothetical protein
MKMLRANGVIIKKKQKKYIKKTRMREKKRMLKKWKKSR